MTPTASSNRQTDLPLAPPLSFEDGRLATVWEKVQAGARLDVDEGLALFRSPDLLGIGAMANWAKERRSGNRVSFVINRQLNPTNLCVLSCRFCDFAAKPGQPKAYVLSDEEILARLSSELREVHIVGGLHAGWTFDDYLHVVRLIRERFPAVQVKAYTAVEVDFFARRERSSIKEILERMMAAGVVCLPGGGAEVFSERVRKALFPFKIGAPRWLEVHRTAHELGLRSNATLLYGHIETTEERVSHMLRLRALQDETGGFLSFIPLAYQPGENGVVPHPPSVVDDLKTIAVARLLLDNIPHIKAYWVTVGESTASVALHFGADDVDGTIGEERIMHAAAARSPQDLARESLIALIRGAGRTPVERDALHQSLNVFSDVESETTTQETT